jgi:hypothetical protein
VVRLPALAAEGNEDGAELPAPLKRDPGAVRGHRERQPVTRQNGGGTAAGPSVVAPGAAR